MQKNLRKNNSESSLNSIYFYACQLSIIEFSLGSFLHAFHIPFSGFILSLNQCYLLNRAIIFSQTSIKYLPIAISNTAAMIKVLSPYGKKFTPMLAISVQGLLFNCGTLLFGHNLAGRFIGSLFLSLWPMTQPLLIYGIIYGSIIPQLGAYYNELLSNQLWMPHLTIQFIIGFYIFMHTSLTICVCLISPYLSRNALKNYECCLKTYTPLLSIKNNKKSGIWEHLRGVLKDFKAPFFLFSLLLSGFFFYATLHSLESFLYAYFRLLSIAFITFFLIRSINTERLIEMCTNSKFFKTCAPYVKQVLEHLQNGQ